MSFSVTPRGGALTGRGGWRAGTVYYQDDIVVWNGLQYQSILPVNIGYQPDVSGGQWAAVVSSSVIAAGMYRGAGLTATASAWTKIPLDTTSFDASGGMASPAQGRINILAAGYYQVHGSVGFVGSASPQGVEAAVYRNGFVYNKGSISTWAATGLGISSLVAATAFWNTGDYIELWYFVNAALALDTFPGSTYLDTVQIQ